MLRFCERGNCFYYSNSLDHVKIRGRKESEFRQFFFVFLLQPFFFFYYRFIIIVKRNKRFYYSKQNQITFLTVLLQTLLTVIWINHHTSVFSSCRCTTVVETSCHRSVLLGSAKYLFCPLLPLTAWTPMDFVRQLGHRAPVLYLYLSIQKVVTIR